jgi:hypothetical protein
MHPVTFRFNRRASGMQSVFADAIARVVNGKNASIQNSHSKSMSRPQKMHAPLPFTFKEVLTAIASGHGVVEKPTAKKPRKEISKRSGVKKSD